MYLHSSTIKENELVRKPSRVPAAIIPKKTPTDEIRNSNVLCNSHIKVHTKVRLAREETLIKDLPFQR